MAALARAWPSGELRRIETKKEAEMRRNTFLILVVLCCAALMISPHLLAQTVVETISRPGMQPTSVAVYETGNRFFIADHTTGNVYMYDGVTHKEMAAIQVGTELFCMLVHEANGKLYALCKGSRRLAVINAATGALIHFLPGIYSGGNLRMVQDAQLGKVYVYTSNEGVRQIDMATDTEVTIVPGPLTPRAGLNVNPNTHEVFFAQL
jgi:DNA-binding beta-propeller fold protein YncE